MDNQHNPFQCNLGYQVSHSGKGKWDKQGDYIGKKVLEQIRSDLKAREKTLQTTASRFEDGRETN